MGEHTAQLLKASNEGGHIIGRTDQTGKHHEIL